MMVPFQQDYEEQMDEAVDPDEVDISSATSGTAAALSSMPGS